MTFLYIFGIYTIERNVMTLEAHYGILYKKKNGQRTLMRLVSLCNKALQKLFHLLFNSLLLQTIAVYYRYTCHSLVILCALQKRWILLDLSNFFFLLNRWILQDCMLKILPICHKCAWIKVARTGPWWNQMKWDVRLYILIYK